MDTPVNDESEADIIFAILVGEAEQALPAIPVGHSVKPKLTLIKGGLWGTPITKRK